MADAINTFDASTQDATDFGLVQKVKGDGFALTYDPKNGKHRYDVWDRDFFRCCPRIGFSAEQATDALCKLASDAALSGNAMAIRKVAAFGRAMKPLLANG